MDVTLIAIKSVEGGVSSAYSTKVHPSIRMESVKPETLNPADEETEGSKLAGQVWQQSLAREALGTRDCPVALFFVIGF